MTCICVWLGAGWEVLEMRGLGLGFTNPGGTGGKWDMCVFWLQWGGWCWWEGVVVKSGLFVLMAGPGICILC